MERLLLHHCCAPCSPNVLKKLSEEYEVQSFWFNPNIQPADEYAKRKQALEMYLKSLGRVLLLSSSGLTRRSKNTSSTEMDPCLRRDDKIGIWSSDKDSAERCKLCYALRLAKTAEEAKKQGIKNFSSTLISSPHQKHEEIKKTASDIAQKEGIVFVYKDFRPFYYDGKNEVKKMGLYSQKYCGCLPSLEEAGK